MLTYLSNEQLISERPISERPIGKRLISQRPWAPTSVCASELTLVSAVPSVPVSVHVASAVAGVSVVGASGVEGVLVAQRPLTQHSLTMKPTWTKTRGITGFTTAAKDNSTASKRTDAVSGVPPRGRPV